VKITLDFKNEIQAGDPVYNNVSERLKSFFSDRQVTLVILGNEFDPAPLFGQSQHGHDPTGLLRCGSQRRRPGTS